MDGKHRSQTTLDHVIACQLNAHQRRVSDVDDEIRPSHCKSNILQMIAKTTQSKADLARQLLNGTAASKFQPDYDQDTSDNGDDDEALHVETDEEEDWEWIYSDDPSEHASANPTSGHGRKRKVSSMLQAALGSNIVGAKRGKFECRLGDVVRLKDEGRDVWTALICAFNDEEDADSMEATFMWLSPETEIRNKAKRRGDALPVGGTNSFTGLGRGTLKLGLSTKGTSHRHLTRTVWTA